ncbi:hypothetical protein D918_02397 [Trichuris suis]|nr:hypothetical protein D918_02397 [Trichuris suis]
MLIIFKSLIHSFCTCMLAASQLSPSPLLFYLCQKLNVKLPDGVPTLFLLQKLWINQSRYTLPVSSNPQLCSRL